VLEGSWAKSLGDGDAVRRRSPVEGVVLPL
jgi:hypothetical protein